MSGPSDYHDFVQLPVGGQVAPTAQASPGQPQALAAVTAQLTTQTNPSTPSYGINSVVQAQQNLAVSPPLYFAAGSRTAV